MNIEKNYNLSLRWLSDCREIAAEAISKGSFSILALNARGVFEHNLMLGLMDWRQQHSPRENLLAAVRSVSEYRNHLLRIDEKKFLPSTLPQESAAIISFLIDENFEIESGCDSGQPADVFLDCVMSKSLSGELDRDSKELGLRKLFEKNRTHLAAETYQNYFGIIERHRDGLPIDEMVTLGEKLYLKRLKDAFYSGGRETEGGGPGNALIVDYHLGAVLKRVGFSGETIHQWRW